MSADYREQRERNEEIWKLRNDNPKQWTYKKLGERYGITTSRVQQLNHKTGARKRYLSIYGKWYAEQKERIEADPLLEPIWTLDVSDRINRLLYAHGIKNLEALMGWTEEDLLTIRNFGVGSLKQLKDCLAKMGYALSNAIYLPNESEVTE